MYNLVVVAHEYNGTLKEDFLFFTAHLGIVDEAPVSMKDFFFIALKTYSLLLQCVGNLHTLRSTAALLRIMRSRLFNFLFNIKGILLF